MKTTPHVPQTALELAQRVLFALDRIKSKELRIGRMFDYVGGPVAGPTDRYCVKGALAFNEGWAKYRSGDSVGAGYDRLCRQLSENLKAQLDNYEDIGFAARADAYPALEWHLSERYSPELRRAEYDAVRAAVEADIERLEGSAK